MSMFSDCNFEVKLYSTGETCMDSYEFNPDQVNVCKEYPCLKFLFQRRNMQDINHLNPEKEVCLNEHAEILND